MKDINYNKPNMEIIILTQTDVITFSVGQDNGKTPTVDFEKEWGNM